MKLLSESRTKAMKPSMSLFKDRILTFAYVIACALGVYFAFITVDRFAVFVRAVLGATLIFLLQKESPFAFAQRKSLRNIIGGFFLTVILFWSGIQILHLFWYLKDIPFPEP
jgi:hypothetical protein